MSGPIHATRPGFPPGVTGMFLDQPGTVTIHINGVKCVWPWDQAMAFAIRLSEMSGRAACRAEATFDDIQTALDYDL